MALVVTFISHFIYHRIWSGQQFFQCFSLSFSLPLPFYTFHFISVHFTISLFYMQQFRKFYLVFIEASPQSVLLGNVHVTPNTMRQIIQFSQQNEHSKPVALGILSFAGVGVHITYTTLLPYANGYNPYLLMTELNAFHCHSTKCHDSDLLIRMDIIWTLGPFTLNGRSELRNYGNSPLLSSQINRTTNPFECVVVVRLFVCFCMVNAHTILMKRLMSLDTFLLATTITSFVMVLNIGLVWLIRMNRLFMAILQRRKGVEWWKSP